MPKIKSIKAGQILEDVLHNLEHLKDVCKDIHPEKYNNELEDLIQRFKLWKPEIFIYIEGGNIQGASANCNMIFNLWDDDNEKAETGENRAEDSDGEDEWERYLHEKETWNWMIETGHKDGSLKPIY